MAKTTSVLNTTLMGFYMGTSGSNTLITHSTDASLSITHSPREITSKGSEGWRQLLEGLRSASGSATFYFVSDHTSAYALQDFWSDCIISRSTIYSAFKSSNTDDTSWGGTCYITSVEVTSSGSEDNMAVTINFDYTGAITMSNT